MDGSYFIQNVCPVTEEYIDCQYMIENNTVPVTINKNLSAEINSIVRKVIRLNKIGIRIVLTNIDHILNELNKMDRAIENFKMNKVSEPVDLSDF